MARGFLRIGSLNSARKAAANTEKLGLVLKNQSMDIFGLQEVKNLHSLDVPGYIWLSGLHAFERPTHHLGLGALVKKDFKGLRTTALINTDHEFMWLKLTGNLNANDTFICFWYCPHSGHMAAKRQHFYAELLGSCSKFASRGDVLLLGDFNARIAAVSGDNATNANGPLFLDFKKSAFSDGKQNEFRCIINSAFGCHSVQTFQKRGQTSIIDYAIIAPESLSRVAKFHIESVDQKFGANAIGSDHHLLYADWLLDVEVPVLDTSTWLIWDKARLQDPETRQAFQHTLEKHLGEWRTSASNFLRLRDMKDLPAEVKQHGLDLVYQNFVMAINLSLKRTVPVKQVGPHSCSWWDAELQNL
jgi:exonuclease III